MGQFTSVLQTVGYLALAVLLLMLMITIHEFGHYITAKIMHFKIYEFSIGMGKPLFKKTKKNGEVFSIRMIPVGGYCAFGEDNVEEDNDPQSFNNKKPWQRLIVLFSGAFFNFVSAIIFAVILLSIVGYGRSVDLNTVFRNQEYDKDNPQVGVNEYITTAEILNLGGNIYDENDNLFVIQYTPYDDDNKATDGPQMYIKTLNGKSMNLMSGASNALSNVHIDDDVNLVVNWEDENGVIVTQNLVIKSLKERQYKALCGSGYSVPLGDKIYHNFGGALIKAVPFSFEVAGLIFKVFGQLLTGQLGMNAVGGTVATVSVMGSSIGEAMSLSPDMAFAQICYLITLISINLAVFNWLPIPSLDGARMVFVIIEWIRGKPINRNLEARIHLIGIICLLGFVLFADAFWIFNKLSFRLLL